jgi:hypothetical protein
MSEEILKRLERLEELLVELVEKNTVKDWYTVEELARMAGREPFTVREWARNGRIRAEKKLSGRGAHASWTVSHSEWQRFQREGLLPLRKSA